MGEILVAFATLAVAVLFFVTSLTFPEIDGDPLGLARVPQFVAAVTAIASLAVVARAARRARANGMALAEPAIARVRCALRAGIANPWRPGVLVIPITFAYPAAVVFSGFLIGTSGYLLVLMKVYRVGTLQAVAIAVCATSLVYAFFTYVAEVSVPAGLWFAG
jgi:hypothetical protein